MSKMLRSGLTVSAFSFLETYLEDRVCELMPVISSSPVGYNSFPERFRGLVTLKAIHGISTRLKFEKADAIGLAERHLRLLSHFPHKRPKYSPMGFSSTGSNISASHISEFINDIGMEGGWATLTSVANLISYTSPSFKDDFQAFGNARNSSAHDPLHDVPSDDLTNYIKTASRVGVAFDLTLTFASHCYKMSPTAQALSDALRGEFPKVAIVERHAPQDWWVALNGSATPEKYDTQQKAERRARKIASLAVVRDSALIPTKIL